MSKYPTNTPAQIKARKTYNEKRKTQPVQTLQLTEVPFVSIIEINNLSNILKLSKSQTFVKILDYYIFNEILNKKS